MASPRMKWHGQDLPVVREIVSIGGVETMVEIPGVDDPRARRIIAALTAVPKFERGGETGLHQSVRGSSGAIHRPRRHR